MNKEIFVEELKKIDLELSEEQLAQLEIYYHLLIAENTKYNLTSITDKETIYLKHFYDSLTISKIINLTNQSLCDIGTGAGFPGLVLKIAFPKLKVTLVDATSKKCNFLKMVIAKLDLKDINVVNERAEIYSRTVREKYDIVTSRAVAPLKHLLEYSIPLVKVDGNYIAMKADITKEVIGIEVYQQKLKLHQDSIISFKLPIEESTRTLIKYQKLAVTPLLYPRKYSDIKKKSL